MEYGKDYFGFVYVWYNRCALEMERQDYQKAGRHHRKSKAHPRLYVGSHYGPIDLIGPKKYICSSRWMKSSYKRRSRNFIRRIIYWQKSPDRKQLLQAEQQWLNLIEIEEYRTRFYNISRAATGASFRKKKLEVFGCGHQRTIENSISAGKDRKKCKICAVIKRKKYRQTEAYRQRRGEYRSLPEQREKIRQQMRRWYFNKKNGNIRPKSGYKVSREQVEKMLAARWSPEKRKAYGDKYRGVPKSEEQKRKIAATLKGRKPNIKTKVCEHCNIAYKEGNYARWHGDNCRYKYNEAT